MNPVQVVVDTNILVAASRSRLGASFQLVQRFGDPRFAINVSVALVFEYEEKLKQEMSHRGTKDLSSVDRFLDYVVAIGNRRSIFFSLMADCVDLEDQFIFDLAIASMAPFIITYNLKHFVGARHYGVWAVKPGDFLRWLEK